MRWGIALASVLGAGAVMAGAFGAHALEASVTPERLQAWNTAAQYHLIHAAVMLALALHSQADDTGWRLIDFSPVALSQKQFLTDDQVIGGLYSFSAIWCKTAAGQA